MGTGFCYDIYIADYNNNALRKIVNNTLAKTINVPNSPQFMCIDKNNVLYVTNADSKTISKIVNDVIVKTIQLDFYPFNILVDKNNNIIIGSSTEGKIYRMENDVITSTISCLARPYKMCIDKNNSIWIITNYNNKSVSVQKIVNNVVVKTFTQFTFPYNLCIDKNNALYVSEYDNIGTSPGGIGANIYKIVNDTIAKTFKSHASVNNMIVNKDNILYINATGEIYKVINDVIQTSTPIYPNYGSIQDMCLDKDNNIWAISAGTGYLAIQKMVNDKFGPAISLPYGYDSADIVSGMEYALLFGEKNLIQSGNIINTFNGTDFSNVGTSPVTDTMLETYGFSDFTGLTKSKLNTLSNPKLLTKKTDSNTTNVNYKGTPLPKLVLAKNDITLSTATSKVDSFTLTATEATAGSNIRIIYSVDQGTTWNTYKSGVQSIVNINDLSTIKANGMTLAEFNSVTDWNTIITDDTIRFGYYLEANSITDNVSTDLMTMQIDMNGAWKTATKDSDYKFYYTNKNTAIVRLLANGDFRLSL